MRERKEMLLRLSLRTWLWRMGSEASTEASTEMDGTGEMTGEADGDGFVTPRRSSSSVRKVSGKQRKALGK